MDTLIDSLPGGNWLTILRIAGGVIGAYLFLIWIASLFWAWRDMRSRTRDFVTRLAGFTVMLFLPLIGYPVYLAVRPSLTLREAYDRQLEQEAILSDLQAVPTCPECRRPVEQDWAICAFCSYELKEPCPGCDRLLHNAWRHCPYCAMQRMRRSEASEPAALATPGQAPDDAGDAPIQGAPDPPRRPRATETVPISARPGRGSSRGRADR